jgi:hypothetical protein
MELYGRTMQKLVGGLPSTLWKRNDDSKEMIALLEALQLEIGCARNPLSEDYALRGGLATMCWMKAIWERVNFYNINLILSYTSIPTPREQDCEIVLIITQHEKSMTIQQSLNRVRLKLQAIFLSCIASYSGTHISKENLYPQVEETNMSTFKFPRQHPTSKDWAQWRNFWYKVYPGLQLPLPLGKWISPSHRLWRWVLDTDKDILFRQSMTKVKYYTRVTIGTTRSGGAFSKVRETDC